MVPISPKGNRHEILRNRLNLHLSGLAVKAGGLMVAAEPQLNLTDESYTNPDILVHPMAMDTPFVRGGDVLLLIEVADSSLEYDLTYKAPVYASFGVREYWVMNANTLETKVHREPDGSAYRVVESGSKRKRLKPALAPELGLSLTELKLDW
jgi:Uma2 family endonuclease